MKGQPDRARRLESLRDAARTRIPLRINGTVRLELFDDDHVAQRLYVTMQPGNFAVTTVEQSSAATISLPAQLFDRLMNGESSAMSAMVRNELKFSGDPQIGRAFVRLFPSSNKDEDPRIRARDSRQNMDARRGGAAVEVSDRGR
ncbi:SCP2 sterol-binding domain-containing protein [Micromonospora chersina]|uniref:SCP2 sterol-binding domain-containing protein n=1 Tax=Micromonospora chersina TaxID=47854 RepID=UPI00371E5DAE